MAEPLVGIIMGSDSDLPTMAETAAVLDEFGVAHETTVVSAHRTPQRMFDYAENAAGRGLKVVIAGAGGAAHLPGMTAAITTVPVIGVPIKSKAMSGVDSLYSIVQMPAGIPVATVAIGGAKNAGLLAVAMLANHDEKLRAKLQAYKDDLKDSVLAKAAKLEKEGPESYLKGMD